MTTSDKVDLVLDHRTGLWHTATCPSRPQDASVGTYPMHYPLGFRSEFVHRCLKRVVNQAAKAADQA